MYVCTYDSAERCLCTLLMVHAALLLCHGFAHIHAHTLCRTNAVHHTHTMPFAVFRLARSDHLIAATFSFVNEDSSKA